MSAGSKDGGPNSGSTLGADELVGTWRLVSWESVAEDGSVDYPFGEWAEGILVYTADGSMVTTIGRAGRSPVSGGDMLSGPVEERIAAFETFIAYSGRFALDGNDVVHTVAMSLFPNWAGTQQRRHVELSADGRRLTLVADPFLVRGRVSSHTLVWQRLG